MDKDKMIQYIASNPKDYLEVQEKSLEQRIEQINISSTEEKEIMTQQGVKLIRDKALSFLGPAGELVTSMLDWNDNVNEEMTQAKKAILLNQYFNKTDHIETSLEDLKKFIVDPKGNTLFNKILRLLDESPPDEELTEHLSTVLKKIIEGGNFEKLFDKHKYALGQIEKLTPQALSIIADYKTWPLFKLGTAISFGPKVTSDFYNEFTVAYASQKKITDTQTLERIKHSIVELQRQGLLEAFSTERGLNRCQLTVIGEDLLVYIEV
jgi:hypothetical protein